MTLKNVDQDLFKHLEKWLGKNGIAKDPARYVQTKLPEKLLPLAKRRVILTEHNPRHHLPAQTRRALPRRPRIRLGRRALHL